MITIIGSGKVGGDAALFSALKRLDDQILLLDVAEGLPQGEAMDISHMLSEQGIDVEVKGSNNFADMKGSNTVVVVAGSGRKPGMTRMDLLKINATIVKSVVENIKKYADNSMIIPVTNPLDPMAYITYKVSGFPLSSFLPKQKLDELVQNTKQVAARVIELKGATVHAPGNAISAMIESVVRDRKQVIPVATYLDGEYGHSDVTIGVPAVIGKRGVEKIIELDLNTEERQSFDAAVQSVKSAISGIQI